MQPTERPHIDEFQLGGVSFKVRVARHMLRCSRVNCVHASDQDSTLAAVLIMRAAREINTFWGFALSAVNVQAWDLGGHEAVRYLWFDFLSDSHAIVFMIDRADGERLEEAHWELSELLSDVSPPETLFLVQMERHRTA